MVNIKELNNIFTFLWAKKTPYTYPYETSEEHEVTDISEYPDLRGNPADKE